MKKYLISTKIIFFITMLFSCSSKEYIMCDYSELLEDRYEETQEKISQYKSNYYIISGVIKRIDRSKDQMSLDECVIYFYDDKTFDDEFWVGRFITIKMKPAISDEFINKKVTICCKYKKMNKKFIRDNYNNYYSIKFEDGKIYHN